MSASQLNQLRVFIAVAKSGSIRGAARKLEISAPSVSQALKHLEKSLEVQLLIRTTRSVTLTDAGRMLLEQVEGPMKSITTALDSVKQLQQEPVGKLRITLPRFVYQTLLKPVYAEFCQRYPKIELELSISDATVHLIDEEFDAGIRFGHRLEPGMVARKLTGPLKNMLFASPDYIECHGLPTTPVELQQHPLIQYRFITSNQITPMELIENREQIRVDMPTALIVNDTDAVIDAALQGMGIGRLIETAVEPYLRTGALIALLPEYWIEYPGLYLYFAQNSQKARRLRVFIDFICERAKEIG
ncbi:LysR family transcriptional regulator [Dongshaea marina]|uniref:LysR family transcriptional regulator n=1 Tax=Dongshaea marina TaxID=2047966 RepID=UPI000D3EB9AC|nr:LysR family transcriptional regulator [Dongshaea marina]